MTKYITLCPVENKLYLCQYDNTSFGVIESTTAHSPDGKLEPKAIEMAKAFGFDINFDNKDFMLGTPARALSNILLTESMIKLSGEKYVSYLSEKGKKEYYSIINSIETNGNQGS